MERENGLNQVLKFFFGQINVRNVLIAAAVQMCALPFDSWPSF